MKCIETRKLLYSKAFLLSISILMKVNLSVKTQYTVSSGWFNMSVCMQSVISNESQANDFQHKVLVKSSMLRFT